MNFSTIKRIKVLISFLCVFIVLLSVAISGSFINNRKTATDHYSEVIRAQGASGVAIQSADGISLYKFDSSKESGKRNTYADNKNVREAFFSLIGTADNKTGDSILTQEKVNSEELRKKEHKYYRKADVKLTINSKLQVKAYQTLCKAESKGGALMVVNYKTGEILCAATAPAVDPTNIPNSNDLPAGSFLFKPVWEYTPGSVMKTVSAAAVLEKKPKLAEKFSYNCTSKYGNEKDKKAKGNVTCGKAHGNVNLAQALFKSCNCAITEVTTSTLSANQYEKFVDQIGLLGTEGQISDFKCRKPGNLDLEGGDYRWAVNGQSNDMVTPAAMMRWYCALANNGVSVSMHLKSETEAEETELVSEETAKFIKNALYGKLDDKEKFPVRAWGKTGTAQQGSDKAHSWFICGIDDKDAPTLCCLVMLENGGESTIAKNVCTKFMKENLLN